jgi:adenosylcobinamide-GDP ribazoletransferase
MRRALSFLTPLAGPMTPSPAALPWFPVVGAGLGFAVGAVWWAAFRLWPPAVAAALVVAVDLGLTGMLHFDGLVDSADGLLPHLSAERRLEVMAEPTVGAFGIGAAGAALLLRMVAFASMRPSVLLVGGLWCASRTLMAVTVTRAPYARSDGLASAFMGSGSRPIAAEGVLSAVVLAALWRPIPGSVAVLLGLAAGIGVVRFAVRRLGGFTGDVLGAAGVVVETVGLVVAAAKW